MEKQQINLTPGRNKNELNGLVLAGGKSTRMGEDKSRLHWHGKEQRYFLAELLQKFCCDVFISCRLEQAEEINGYAVITDRYEDEGPLGAIASAFLTKNLPWLVVACDLPLVNESTIDELIRNRNTTATATAFQSPFDGLPEPLIAIWEPASLTLLLAALAEGKRSPRNMLMDANIHMLKAADSSALTNVNTTEERNRVELILRQRKMINR